MEDIYVGKRKNKITTIISVFFRALIIAGILITFWIGIQSISKSNVDRQMDSLNDALKRDIVQCYSIEGIYPPSLEYLEQHYGLIYDKDLFFIDYRPIASNIYPDVTVLCLTNDAEDAP